MIMIFILGNRCTSLVEDVDQGGGYVCGGSGYVGNLFPSQFYYKPESVLKFFFFWGVLLGLYLWAYGGSQARG